MPTRRLQAKRLFSIIFLLIQKGSWKFIVRRLETRFVLKSLYSCKTRRKQKKILYSLFHFLKLILFAVVCERTWLEIIRFWNFVLDFDENSFESYKNDWLNFFTHFDLFFVVNLFAWIEKRLKFFWRPFDLKFKYILNCWAVTAHKYAQLLLFLSDNFLNAFTIITQGLNPLFIQMTFQSHVSQSPTQQS